VGVLGRYVSAPVAPSTLNVPSELPVRALDVANKLSLFLEDCGHSVVFAPARRCL